MKASAIAAHCTGGWVRYYYIKIDTHITIYTILLPPQKTRILPLYNTAVQRPKAAHISFCVELLFKAMSSPPKNTLPAGAQYCSTAPESYGGEVQLSYSPLAAVRLAPGGNLVGQTLLSPTAGHSSRKNNRHNTFILPGTFLRNCRAIPETKGGITQLYHLVIPW